MALEPKMAQKAKRRSPIWAMAAPYRPQMALLALVSLGGALLEAAFLVMLTSAAMSMASGRTALTGPVAGLSIEVALVAGAAAMIIRLGLGLAAVWISSDLTAKVTREHRRRLSRAYLDTSWQVQQNEPTGRLQEILVSFVYRITNAMSSLTQGLTAALSLIAFLGAGFFVDSLSTLAVLGALGGLGMVLTPMRRAIRRRSGESAKSNIAFANAVAELGTLGQEMQTFGVRERFAERIDGLTEQTTENNRRVQALSGTLTPVYTFLAYSAVLAAIAILSRIGIEDLTAVGSVMLLMLRSLSYGQQLLAVAGTLSAAQPFLERIEDTVATYEATPAPTGSVVPARLTPVALDDVSFSYTNDRHALAGVNVTIQPGEMIGVIGPSGAGKSTLAQLLLGLQDPSSGVITVSGTDLREVDRAWWTRRVAFVPQDPLLFTGTVAENIRFFRDGLSDAELKRAAEQSNVWADIQDLPAGLDTHLGQRGSQLSGGQRQRLSIARALVGQPDLLILDEPTSALDGQSEVLVRDTLEDLHGRVTILIIAHRMSTLDLCDRIMVIQAGLISAFDTPQKLQANSEFYRNALTVAGMT